LTPNGVPLYPVLMMRLSTTINAPTRRRIQLERLATTHAMLM
jgi:hypothetical protein